jgi:hypothetical protein
MSKDKELRQGMIEKITEMMQRGETANIQRSEDRDNKKGGLRQEEHGK